MSDYRIEAASKEEWAERALRAEAKLALRTGEADAKTTIIKELEAKLAKVVETLESWLELSMHCTIEEGVCCCGDSMDTHANPMDCGHVPVDHGAYVAMLLVESSNTILAELKGDAK